MKIILGFFILFMSIPVLVKANLIATPPPGFAVVTIVGEAQYIGNAEETIIAIASSSSARKELFHVSCSMVNTTQTGKLRYKEKHSGAWETYDIQDYTKADERDGLHLEITTVLSDSALVTWDALVAEDPAISIPTQYSYRLLP